MKAWLALIISIHFSASLLAQIHPYDTRADEVDISHYDLALDFRSMDQSLIYGAATLHFAPVSAPLDSLVLDLKGLTVDSVVGQGQLLSFVQQGEFLAIDLPGVVSGPDSLTVYYGGTPMQDPSFGGFYFDQGFAFNVGVSLTQIPHNYGRVWFPCLDFFIDRATYDYRLTLPAQKFATAGGMLQADSILPSGDRYMHYRSLHDYPTYLASVAVGDFVTMEDTLLSQTGAIIPIVLAARPQDTASFRTAAQHLKQAFHLFEASFGDFRFSKVGYSLVPMTGGAMEHAENIAYPILLAQSGLLYQDVLVHELSHSWWGNLATCRTAEDMWLNEGMAVFSEWRFNELFYGRNRYLELYRTAHKDLLQNAHFDDQGFWPLSGVPQQHTYSNTTYAKGADFVHTLRSYLGDHLFFQGLKQALAATAWEDWDAQDFMLALEQATGASLQDFFQDWIYEGGWPLVLPHRWTEVSGQAGSWTIALQQFTRGRQHFCSNVPLELTFFDAQGATEIHTVMVSGETDSVVVQLNLEPEWVIGNLNEALSFAETQVDTVLGGSGTKQLSYANWRLDLPGGNSQNYRVIATQRWTEPGGWKSQYQLNPQRHWALYVPDGLPDGTTAQLYYNGRLVGNNGRLDNELIVAGEDSLVLLYRATRTQSWEVISDDPSRCQHLPGPSLSDKIGIFELIDPQSGEYVLARRVTTGLPAEEQDQGMLWYPNPLTPNEPLRAKGSCLTESSELWITDIQGRKAGTLEQISPDSYRIVPQPLPGLYVLQGRAASCSLGKTKLHIIP